MNMNLLHYINYIYKKTIIIKLLNNFYRLFLYLFKIIN